MPGKEVNDKLLNIVKFSGEEIKIEQLLTHESSFLREFVQIILDNNLKFTTIVKEDKEKYLFAIPNLNSGKIEVFRLWRTTSGWDLEKDYIHRIEKIRVLKFYCLLGNITFPSRVYKEIYYNIRM